MCRGLLPRHTITYSVVKKMFNDKNIAYKEIIGKADGGNPAAMFELAMLYDSNAIPSHYDDDYIYWLKKFLLSEQIQTIIDDLDDEEGTSSVNCFDFIECYQYYPMIIEAGLALGLYYKNSSNIDEVKLAAKAFYYAFLTSRFDHIEMDDDGSITDIVTLLSQTNDRIMLLSGGVESND